MVPFAVEHNDEAITFRLVDGSVSGVCACSLSPSGIFECVPFADASGACRFQWNVVDARGASSLAIGLVNVNVVAVPDAPVCKDVTYEVTYAIKHHVALENVSASM